MKRSNMKEHAEADEASEWKESFVKREQQQQPETAPRGALESNAPPQGWCAPHMTQF